MNLLIEKQKPTSFISFLSDNFINSLEEDEYIIKESFNKSKKNKDKKVRKKQK